MSVRILGTGSYLPPKIVTNDDLSKSLDTSDEWIWSHTGIRSRHIAEAEDCTSTMAAKAAQAALAIITLSLKYLYFILKNSHLRHFRIVVLACSEFFFDFLECVECVFHVFERVCRCRDDSEDDHASRDDRICHD